MKEEVVCDVCHIEIAYPICFRLNPCGHKTCVKCFHELVPAKFFLRCPCSNCRQWVKSSTLLESSEATLCERSNYQSKSTRIQEDEEQPKTQKVQKIETTTGAVPTLSSNSTTSNETITHHERALLESNLREIQEVTHFQPDEQMDPFRHWAIEKPSLYTGFVYAAYRFSNNEATFYKSNFRAVDSSVEMDDNSSDELVKIFARILHPLLFRRGFSSKMKQEENMDEIVNDHLYQEQTYQYQNHQHLAMRCLYALSSGLTLTSNEQEKIFEKGTGNNEENYFLHNELNGKPLKILASEIMKAYKRACQLNRPGPAFMESTLESPLFSPPMRSSTTVHDLRPRRVRGVKEKRIDALERLLKMMDEYQEQRLQRQENGRDAEIPITSESDVDSEDDSNDSRLEKEFEWLDEVLYKFGSCGASCKSSDDNVSSLTSALLWILGVLIVLSK